MCAMIKYQNKNIWKIIDQYDIIPILDNTCNNIHCNLCGNLLMDSRITPCGCRFCKKCIENYLADENKYCPGNTDECEEEILSLEDNINRRVTNRRVLKLIVKCPIDDCKYKDRIDKIEEHLTICIQQAIKCQYSNNGCKFVSLDANNVDLHERNTKDEHIKLLLLQLENTKKENECFNNKQIYIEEMEQQINQHVNVENNLRESEILIKSLRQELIDKDEKLKTKQSEIDDNIQQIKEIKLSFVRYIEDNIKEIDWTIDKFASYQNKGKFLKSDLFQPFNNEFTIQLKLQFRPFGETIPITLDILRNYHPKILEDYQYLFIIRIINEDTGLLSFKQEFNDKSYSRHIENWNIPASAQKNDRIIIKLESKLIKTN